MSLTRICCCAGSAHGTTLVNPIVSCATTGREKRSWSPARDMCMDPLTLAGAGASYLPTNQSFCTANFCRPVG